MTPSRSLVGWRRSSRRSTPRLGGLCRVETAPLRPARRTSFAGDGFTVAGLPVNRGVWQRDRGQYDAAREVFGPCAGAALYRRTALARVSAAGARPFDEDLFMYCEDVDLNWRLQLAGERSVFAPEARVSHHLTRPGVGRLPPTTSRAISCWS